jgi:hypothetical protein
VRTGSPASNATVSPLSFGSIGPSPADALSEAGIRSPAREGGSCLTSLILEAGTLHPARAAPLCDRRWRRFVAVSSLWPQSPHRQLTPRRPGSFWTLDVANPSPNCHAEPRRLHGALLCFCLRWARSVSAATGPNRLAGVPLP